MKTFGNKALLGAIAALSMAWSGSVLAQVTIDNGITGDGFWSVTVQNAGNSSEGVIDPVGADPTDVIFSFRTHYDNGGDGVDGQLSDTTTMPATLTAPGQVTSMGTFPGSNGTVEWTVVASIAPGSPLYQVEISFASAQPFGDTRIVNYFDQDVLGAGNDKVIVVGTPGSNDFQLLTVESSFPPNVGVAHAAAYNSPTNMTWAGWAAAFFGSFPSVFSVSGETGGLPATTDTRFPGAPAYGPADVTTSFAFDFDPDATSASVVFAMGGSPDAQPLPPPVQPRQIPIPTLDRPGMGAMIVLMLLFAGLVGFRRLS
jgi:hypothetical protein